MIYDLPEVKGALKPLPLAALGTVIALVIAIEITIFDRYSQPRANTDKVSQSQETILAIEDILKRILNMQTAERGLVISASEAFLEPYQLGREALDAAIERALKLTSTDPEQSARPQKVLILEAEWRARFREPPIDKRRALAVNGGSITFWKFAQLDSSDTRQKGGTGLGLSIAKSLVEKMRGHIECLSDTGRWTIFSVELPLHASSAAAREWSDNSALT